LRKVAEKARELGASVHMPRIGMGLGGCKDWSKIEPLIKESMSDLNVTVYDFG
jgi:O-acetyl-ADP-ribose deacetylase (regulator of RNase III)